MLFRLILFVVICGLAYALYKKIQKQSSEKLDSSPKEPTTTEMKRCAKCGVHLPINECIQYQTLHFCCEDHKKAYLEDHSAGDDSSNS
ncbi:MAG: hypothetical protein MI867_28390 [Pseudomonadales bacterium]|nr:hypothetical protein [Pseudomonadales bacterium]